MADSIRSSSGHGGRLCSQCLPGYFADGRVCARCLSQVASQCVVGLFFNSCCGIQELEWLPILAFLLLFVALLAYLYWDAKPDDAAAAEPKSHILRILIFRESPCSFVAAPLTSRV